MKSQVNILLSLVEDLGLGDSIGKGWRVNESGEGKEGEITKLPS